MITFKEKYINPFTDYGFKRLFGEEPNKDLLLDFLNELLKEKEGKIVELSYLPNEKLPLIIGDRRAIYDLYCKNEKGEYFIVEMQKAEQKYFKDRMLFYSTFPIQEQAKNHGKNWNFKLKHVYSIGILDFEFEEDKHEPNKYRYDVSLFDKKTKTEFYDKLTYVYLSMPKFNKSLEELETKFDKWLYVLKHLDTFDRIPDKIKGKIFQKVFKVAELAKFNKEELRNYEASMNAYRDIKNSIDTAFEKGEIKGEIRGIIKGEIRGEIKGAIKGHKKGMIEVAIEMIKDNESLTKIIKYTGLTKEEVTKLKQD